MVMSLPSKPILPARAGSMPKIVLKTVDLPAPFGPITVVMPPRGTENVVPLRMVILPYPAVTLRRLLKQRHRQSEPSALKLRMPGMLRTCSPRPPLILMRKSRTWARR